MNMEDFTKIGLLDFQSRGGQNSSFHSHNHNSGLLPPTDFSTFQPGQRTKFSPRETPNTGPRNAHQATTSTSWNLEELMSDLSLVYVSGDREGLEGEKLQFCTSNCCNSRVKYARVCKERETTPWDRETTTSTWDIPRQITSRDMLSSWDLGSDGASTPGSGYNCWANTQDSLGLVGRAGQQWAGADFSSIQQNLGLSHQTLVENHIFEDPENFDSWAACDALLGSETGPVGLDGVENKWNRIKRKSKKTKTNK